MARKSTLPEPKPFKLLRDEGKSEGMAEGERAKAIEAAGKLLEHSVPWKIITDSTGVRPSDVKQKKASKK